MDGNLVHAQYTEHHPGVVIEFCGGRILLSIPLINHFAKGFDTVTDAIQYVIEAFHKIGTVYTDSEFIREIASVALNYNVPTTPMNLEEAGRLPTCRYNIGLIFHNIRRLGKNKFIMADVFTDKMVSISSDIVFPNSETITDSPEEDLLKLINCQIKLKNDDPSCNTWMIALI
jgi:hypothetical protein